MAFRGEEGNQTGRAAEPAGAAARRIDLRGPAAGEHAGIGVRTDQRDRLHRVAAQRQLAAAFFSSTEPCSAIGLRRIRAAERIDHAAARRIVHDAKANSVRTMR